MSSRPGSVASRLRATGTQVDADERLAAMPALRYAADDVIAASKAAPLQSVLRRPARTRYSAEPAGESPSGPRANTTALVPERVLAREVAARSARQEACTR